MKVLFVSLNSLQEHSGGGLYVRSLYRGLCACARVEAVVKGEQRWPQHDVSQGIWTLPKNALTDLLARLFVCPSFIGAYFPLVLWRMLFADVVIFHNSRHGILLLLGKWLLPWKCFAVISDNVEQKLNSDLRSASLIRRLVQKADALLIPLAERLCYQRADIHAFITADDRHFFEQKYGARSVPSAIVPVYLPLILPPEPRAYGGRKNILFTASFRHSPNVSALKTIFNFALRCPSCQFIVAGLALGQIDFLHQAPANVRLVDSPGDDEMQALFRQADLYFCPVDEGSGMKTKIAEALRAFIPALVSAHSAIGYEAAIASGTVQVYRDLDDALSIVDDWLSMDAATVCAQRMRAGAVYHREYSDAAGQQVFARLLQDSGSGRSRH